YGVGMDVRRSPSGHRCGESHQDDRYKIAYEEWIDKTRFVQEWISSGRLPAKYLGWHRADIMRDLIENAAPAPSGEAVMSVRVGGNKSTVSEWLSSPCALPDGDNLLYLHPPAAERDAEDAAAIERIAARLHEEAADEPWTVA